MCLVGDNHQRAEISNLKIEKFLKREAPGCIISDEGEDKSIAFSCCYKMVFLFAFLLIKIKSSFQSL